MINNKAFLVVAVIIPGIISLLASCLQTALSQSDIIDVASGEIAPIGGETVYYTFSVPEEAVNPRLIGQYEVLKGETIKVNVLDQDRCPSPLSAFDCISIYSASNRDRGNIDVGLTPGKTYYLEFNNDGFLSGGKTTSVDFYVQSD